MRVLIALFSVALVLTACGGSDEAPLAPPVTTTQAARPLDPDWKIIGNTGPERGIEGFADKTSALPGEPVKLFVSTTAANYTVTADRMGHYGNADGAQVVWRSEPQPGRKQAEPVIDPKTHMVTAPWDESLRLETVDWPPGNYLLKLEGDNGAKQYVPLTIRQKSNVGKIVIVNAVTTWQAYNKWGGYSLYDSPSGEKSKRARVVSFDRPYQSNTMLGAGDYTYFELALVFFAEASGHQLGYATDVDLEADPHLLDGAKGVITLSHDEYWSSKMRNALVRARDNGTNIAFLGGNDGFRHMRFEPSKLGPHRQEVVYKDFAEDPMSKTNPDQATQEWRAPPNPRPESALLGNYYQCNPVKADLVTADAEHWLTKGLLKVGERLPNLVKDEYNSVDLNVPTPRPLQVLFHSPLTCHGKHDFADVTYYTVPSGAGVLAAGTEYWVCGLDPFCDVEPTERTRNIMREMTKRILDEFSQGPVGKKYPAVDNLVAVKVPGATAAPTTPQIPNAYVPE